MAHRQIHPFDKSRIEPAREAHPLQAGLESSFGSQAHNVSDPNELAPTIAFFHLAVDQTRRHLPLTHVPASMTHMEPVSKMGRQRIKVYIEAITGEKWETSRVQGVSQGVDDAMRGVLRTGTQMEDGK